MRRIALGLSAAFVLLLSFFYLGTPAQAYCVCRPYAAAHYGGVPGWRGYGPHYPYGWHRGWRRGWGAPGWRGGRGSGLGYRPGIGVGAPGFGWRRGREW